MGALAREADKLSWLEIVHQPEALKGSKYKYDCSTWPESPLSICTRSSIIEIGVNPGAIQQLAQAGVVVKEEELSKAMQGCIIRVMALQQCMNLANIGVVCDEKKRCK